MTTVRPSSEIAAQLEASARDGATVPVIVGQRVPTSGYAVGQHGTTGHFGTLDVAGWVESVRAEVAAKPMHFVGIWTDTAWTFLDVVRVFSERAEALADAKGRGEMAIYDLGRSECIYLTDLDREPALI